MSSALNSSMTNSTEAGSTTGAYSPVPVTDAAATALLTKALGDDRLYASDVSTRLCFTAIDSIKSQVVAGTNYQFTVEACSIKAAADGQGKCGGVVAACSPKQYIITIFEQSWTNTVTVTEIKATSSQTQASDTSTAPAATVATPKPSSSAGGRTTLSAAAILIAMLALSSVA